MNANNILFLGGIYMIQYKTVEYLSQKTINDIIKRDNNHMLVIEFSNGLGGYFYRCCTGTISELDNAKNEWLEYANTLVKKFYTMKKRYNTFYITYYYKSGKKYVHKMF